jgi:small-conductance mechanosensitive channel
MYDCRGRLTNQFYDVTTNSCVGLFVRRQLLASQVTNFNKLSNVITGLVGRLLVILLIFVLAACFEVDIRELLVSASAMLLSVSFALGSSISRAVESVIFVFGTYAYSIGDRVVIGPDVSELTYVHIATVI